MRLLFDQNLSRRLVQQLATEFPDSKHTSCLGLEQADDLIVWDYARVNGLMIASKDTDFLHLALLRGHPPKVVYLEIGNCPTEAICKLLKDSQQRIKQFSADPIESFLMLRPQSPGRVG